MEKMTPEYIRAHMVELHTHESFGRSLLEQILHHTESQIEKAGGSMEKVEFDAKIVVEPYRPEGCTEITVNIGFAKIKKHV